MSQSLSRFLWQFLDFVGGASLLFKEFLRQLFRTGNSLALTLDQVFHIGYRSLPLVLVTAISTGAVMALQFGLGLERFGGTLYVPRLVTVAILREMGPVFTGIMIAARVGAGIASEIGSMMVTQQIDAMRAMGTSPIQKIVIPRVLGCLITIPLLVALGNLVSFLGALAVGATQLKLDPQFLVLKALVGLDLWDYMAGFLKSFFFAFFISIPACYYGLSVRQGTQEVGIATTRAVVTSSVLILIGDFVLTKLLWMVEKWT
jgi:phospholipid/cholesterol/gamma-HCH transport system permease protein